MAAKVKRVRWECPNGLHPGVLGSTRPRANATVRYCLPCSEAAGVLVERVAPALERKRRVKVEAKKERRSTAGERAAASLAERAKITCRDAAGREVVVDLLREVEECSALLGIRTPKVRVLRRQTHPGHGVGGKGYPESHTVSFTMHRDFGSRDGAAEQLWELVLHECIHVSGTRRVKRNRSRWHGPQFKRRLYDAARERWPQIVGLCADEGLIHSGKAYDLDDTIIESLRACTRLDAETAELAA